MAAPSHVLRLQLASLTPDAFEQLVLALVETEAEDARRLTGSDRGVDVIAAGHTWGVQCKRFTSGVQWSQCEQSLATALKHHRQLKRYTFVFPSDFDAAAAETFRARLARESGPRVDAWTLSDLRNRLELHPRLVSLLPEGISGGAAATSEPVPAFRLVGREQDLKDIRAALPLGAPARLALHGLSGAGKSQLALALKSERHDRYAYAWWMTVNGPAALASAALVITRDLNQGDAAEGADIVARTREALGRLEEPWLLVLDDAPDPAAISGLLPSRGVGHVLVTSLNPSWKAVGALEIPVKPLDRAVAAEFLAERSGRPLDDGLRAIAHDLEGLALAVEQVGAYLEETPTMSVQEYREAFTRRAAELLRRGSVPAGTRPVATVLSLAIDRATEQLPAAADLLALLSHLGHRNAPLLLFDTERSLSVADPIVRGDAVAALRRYSLIEVDGAETVSTHRLVQIIARATSSATTEWARAAAGLVWDAVPAVQHIPESWPVMDMLVEHAFVAADHVGGTEGGDQLASSLLNAAGNYLRSRGLFAEALACYERACELLVTAEDTDDDRLRSYAMRLNNLGAALGDLGRLEEAEAVHRETLALRQQLFAPDDDPIALSAGNLAGVIADQGRYDEALVFARMSWEIRRKRADDDRSRGWGAHDLADVLLGADETEEALALADEAVRIMSLPPREGMAESASDLGWALEARGRARLACGDLDGAAQDADTSLAMFLRAGEDHPDAARAWVLTAEVASASGDAQAATRAHAAAIRLTGGAEDHPLAGRIDLIDPERNEPA